MMDRTLFGQRVLDVMRAVDFLWERCYIAPQIDKGRLAILGEGVGGLWGLYAAALDGRVAAVIALDTLYSYPALSTPSNQVVPPSPAMEFTMSVVPAMANRSIGLRNTSVIG